LEVVPEAAVEGQGQLSGFGAAQRHVPNPATSTLDSLPGGDERRAAVASSLRVPASSGPDGIRRLIPQREKGRADLFPEFVQSAAACPPDKVSVPASERR